VGDAAFDQALRPIAERGFWNDEGRFGRHAVAVAAGRLFTPREEGQRRTRSADLVPVVKMPYARIVEVDGPLHHPQAQVAGVEGNVVCRIATNRRNVMDASAGAHHRAPLESWFLPRRTHECRRYDFMRTVRANGTIPRDSIVLPALPQLRHPAAARLTPRAKIMTNQSNQTEGPATNTNRREGTAPVRRALSLLVSHPLNA
jgi:hypothetical protein